MHSTTVKSVLLRQKVSEIDSCITPLAYNPLKMATILVKPPRVLYTTHYLKMNLKCKTWLRSALKFDLEILMFHIAAKQASRC